jgi:ribonuclease HI
MPEFTCTRCGDPFTVPDAVLGRYPGWTPSVCRACRGETGSGRRGGSKKPKAPRRRSSRRAEENLTVAEVLDRYDAGPTDGVFTDGSADPNPGPGGGGAVYVVDNEVVAHDHGSDPGTTNNRMEMTALIAGFDLVPEKTPAVVYSDSNLCVRTVNEWAAQWAARGWRRKTGPVENLDLVKGAYERTRRRPEVTVQWIRAHDGSRWNEYADSLASAYRRDRV